MQLSLSDALVVKRENLFLITPRDGAFSAAGEHPMGLWRGDARHLSACELRVNGAAPLLLRASDAPGTRSLQHLASEGLSVRRERELSSPSVLEERLVLGARADPVAVRVDLELAADFESMLVLRGLAPRVERPPAEVEVTDGSVRFSLVGRDGVRRTTTVELSRLPSQVRPGPGSVALGFDLELAAGDRSELGLRVVTGDSGAPAPAAPRPGAEPAVRTDDELFNRILDRSLRDLSLLRSELHGHTFYAAGVPWYVTLFGRDSLIAAIQSLAFAPEVAADTLRLLARLQGTSVAAERDEEPGKILHELREGEPAALGETPFARYYGSADATPLWLLLLASYCDWSGRLDLFAELRDHVEAALGWIAARTEADGLVWYRQVAPAGLRNQGWRDSPAGVPDAAGRPLEPPVALVEVQGYVAHALERTAALFEASGERDRAGELRRRAERTRAALERFWLPDERAYAIGLDGEGRPGSGSTSNPGHLLWAEALPADRAGAVAECLTGAGLFSGWGMRTLAEGHAGYDPLGYHTGSVWPHDNALLAAGLREYEHDDAFRRLFDALLDAASRFPDLRLPELFSGHARVTGEDPVPYPVACQPHAWAAGTVPYLLVTALGLRPEGLAGRLRVVRPCLPGWFDRVEVEGLRVRGATVDLRVERSGDEAVVADARARGDLELIVEDAAPG